MAEVVFRAEAEEDLFEIYARGVSEFGVDVARKYANGIDQALARLADHPMIGPAYPGVRRAIRYLAFQRHHIFYDFDGTTVWIVRILHHAQDAGRLL